MKILIKAMSEKEKEHSLLRFFSPQPLKGSSETKQL